EMPGGALTESEFIRAVLEESGCDLLLDVNNAYLNAVNHGRDPLRALLSLPLERTRQIHLAGHLEEDGVLLDTHDSAIASPVWDLFREAVARVGPVPVLIEWDVDIPSLDAVLDEADRARAIVAEVTGKETAAHDSAASSLLRDDAPVPPGGAHTRRRDGAPRAMSVR